jgi:hypothetical protein
VRPPAKPVERASHHGAAVVASLDPLAAQFAAMI